MKGLDNPTWLMMYIISNLVALLVLWASWKSARLGRFLFLLLFLWAGITNWVTALRTPGDYLGQADLTFFTFYHDFILGWFSRHILLGVGIIATCQLVIAISMVMKGWWVKAGGCGAILFLLAIAPFGVGSAFPCTLLLAAAMIYILRRRNHDWLWRSRAGISGDSGRNKNPGNI